MLVRLLNVVTDMTALEFFLYVGLIIGCRHYYRDLVEIMIFQIVMYHFGGFFTIQLRHVHVGENYFVSSVTAGFFIVFDK